MVSTKALLTYLCTFAIFGRAYSAPQQATSETQTSIVIITETQTTTETEKTTTTVSNTLTNDQPTSDTSATATATSTDSSPQEPSSSDVSTIGSCYYVPGVGALAIGKRYEFSSGEIPSDLQISDYDVPDRQADNPWNHGFKPSNVYAVDGLLHLLVPGEQDPARDPKEAIWGGEIYTSEANILYGSFRTRAIFDSTPGTCQGIFSYHDDTSEIDIEYMGNSSSTANPSPPSAPVLWYTNQPGNKPDNQVTGPAPRDVATTTHEYRIDWTEEWTKFYIDGELQQTLRGDVPEVGSQWVWNNWANGSPYWSTGPPVTDNVMKIESITMYYNTTETTSCE